jgi:hypothetical protein
MIRNILISTAALLAGPAAPDANAAGFEPTPVSITVSLAGKTEATVKAEIAKASETACAGVAFEEHSACVHETYQNALAKLARVKAMRTASLAF